MENFKAIKGNLDNEHLEIDAVIDDIGNVACINYTLLHMFGVSTPIDPSVDFHNALITFVESEYKRIKKYRRLEFFFLETLRDKVIIETEETYLVALKEFNSRTKDMNDDGMRDANN
tara:strand:- start:19796 stop:20146 length:351 start_codon:yes stop_codon:yes gene_type:complete